MVCDNLFGLTGTTSFTVDESMDSFGNKYHLGWADDSELNYLKQNPEGLPEAFLQAVGQVTISGSIDHIGIDGKPNARIFGKRIFVPNVTSGEFLRPQKGYFCWGEEEVSPRGAEAFVGVVDWPARRDNVVKCVPISRSADEVGAKWLGHETVGQYFGLKGVVIKLDAAVLNADGLYEYGKEFGIDGASALRSVAQATLAAGRQFQNVSDKPVRLLCSDGFAEIAGLGAKKAISSAR